MEKLGNLSIGDKTKWQGYIWTIVDKSGDSVSLLSDDGIENPMRKILEGETK